MAAARKLVSLAEPLGGFLFLHTLLPWLEGGTPPRRNLSSPTPKAPAGGRLELRSEDVERVLDTLGLYEEGAERLEEGRWSSDELSALFEDKEPSLDEVKETFSVFDDDGDGFIDAAELRAVLARLGFPEAAEPDACRRMIDSYDGNGDGKIDFPEFVKFMETGFC